MVREEEIARESLMSRLAPASRRLFRELINPENYNLTVSQVCAKADVNESTYYRRMREDDFVSVVRAVQRRQVESKIGNVLNATYRYALKERGHQDRKMLLTWAGEYAEKSETKIEGGLDIGNVSRALQRYLVEDDGEDSQAEDEAFDDDEADGEDSLVEDEADG